MKTLLVTLRPLTPFGTPMAGDTMFGHLCWALRLRHGEAALRAALEGYTADRPFLVVSDGFPSGYLPRPTLPTTASVQPALDPRIRKEERRKRWLPLSGAQQPLRQWLGLAADVSISRDTARTQNTINRLTGTTGSGLFAPRQLALRGYAPGACVDVHLVYDPQRIRAEDVQRLLADVGATGFGRDASTGLGKFDVVSVTEKTAPPASRYFMTLAPCAPDPAVLQTELCRWLPVTRFGRHGGSAALGGGGGPFKRPILLAATGAVWAAHGDWTLPFFGRGLGGDQQRISGALPATVHQGYAPVQPLYAESTI